MQWAPQLAREQLCKEGGRELWLVTFNEGGNNGWTASQLLLSSPTIMLSSLSKCFFHMTAASSEILKKDKKSDQNVFAWRRLTVLKMHKKWGNLLPRNIVTTKKLSTKRKHTHRNLANFCSGSFPVLLMYGLRLISVCSLSNRNRRNSWASCWLGSTQRNTTVTLSSS